MLTDHRRALRFSLALLAAMVFMLIAVGRHPDYEAPKTTLAFVGNFDQSVYTWMDDIRNVVLTGLFRFLNVAGGGMVTIPLRIIVTLLLLFTRRFRAMFAFILTWAASEALLTWFKVFFHRGRPADAPGGDRRLLLPVGPCGRRRGDRRGPGAWSPSRRDRDGSSGNAAPWRSHS